ncbi:MAG: 7-carboxy-7-deazaguanine synthase QueE [Legionellaceae bacterium]|nr:7-carboxy-7-deazaguanine synthase QueE [Legionellaceae bacterium]
MSRFEDALRITEIFHSIQGESGKTGLATVFVRLTGCPLRCQYCDTAYAFNGGQMMAIEAIVQQISQYDCPHVCITGGEPLAQIGCLNLMDQLCEAGFQVSLETSGARDIQHVNPKVLIVMDLKTPGSAECDKNLWQNLNYLKANDEIKFVLCSEADYHWAVEMLNTHQLHRHHQVLFSPSWGQLSPTELANWILRDKLQVRFQLQLHKILWNDAPGH